MWFAFRMQQEVAKAQTSFSVHGSCTACLSFLNGGPITIKSVALKRETPIHPTLNPIFAETSCALLGGRVTTAPSLCLLSSVLPPHRFYCRSTRLEGHSGPLTHIRMPIAFVDQWDIEHMRNGALIKSSQSKARWMMLWPCTFKWLNVYTGCIYKYLKKTCSLLHTVLEYMFSTCTTHMCVNWWYFA